MSAEKVTKIAPERSVIWQPQPRQAAFMARPEYEVLYGGAAGGGKSDALLAEALRQVHIPHYRGLIIRRTYPQLEALISRSHMMYQPAYPAAKYNATEHVWKFPSGARIFFGSMQREDDKYAYQGRAFDFVAFDELTHFTSTQYQYLMSRNRPTGPGTRVYCRATANPGGVGHGFVKARFIDPAPPMTPITDDYEVFRPDGTRMVMERTRIFVPSTVFDNKILLANDPNYLATLASLPEAERNALLYGDWSSFEGQVFREWKDDPAHYKDRLWTHVVEPFKIPDHWMIWRGFDFGYAKPFSVGWYAADERGKLYRVREYYGCTGEPNRGVQLHPVEIAKTIREIEHTDPLLKGHQITGVADPSIFDESRGQSIAAMMGQSPNFVLWSPGDNTRLAGLQQYHYRLAFDERGECMFQVFNSCKHFIRTIPSLVYDEKHVEDVDTSLEDHIYDECITAETKVLTTKGKCDIMSLVGTEGYVYSSDGKAHKYHDCRLTRRNAKIYAVELEDGTIFRATGNHPVLLTDGRYVPISQLSAGDDVACIGDDIYGSCKDSYGETAGV